MDQYSSFLGSVGALLGFWHWLRLVGRTTQWPQQSSNYSVSVRLIPARRKGRDSVYLKAIGVQGHTLQANKTLENSHTNWKVQTFVTDSGIVRKSGFPTPGLVPLDSSRNSVLFGGIYVSGTPIWTRIGPRSILGQQFQNNLFKYARILLGKGAAPHHVSNKRSKYSHLPTLTHTYSHLPVLTPHSTYSPIAALICALKQAPTLILELSNWRGCSLCNSRRIGPNSNLNKLKPLKPWKNN